MLKLGKMYTVDGGEYNIFILKNENIDRLEIGTSTSKWHSIDSLILYGEYTRKVFRTYGNAELGKLYKDTITTAKTIDVHEQMDMKLEDGVFFRRFTKRLSDSEYYSFTEKDGKLDSEVCVYGGAKIILYVFDTTCNLDLEPLNFPQYKRSKKQAELPYLTWPRSCDGQYEDYLFMSSVYRFLFYFYTRTKINIDSPCELRKLLYEDLGLPVVAREQDGTASVDEEVIKKLARRKRKEPVNIFTNDIKSGRVTVSAKRLNNAKYPETVLLEKYLQCKKKAESHHMPPFIDLHEDSQKGLRANFTKQGGTYVLNC